MNWFLIIQFLLLFQERYLWLSTVKQSFDIGSVHEGYEGSQYRYQDSQLCILVCQETHYGSRPYSGNGCQRHVLRKSQDQRPDKDREDEGKDHIMGNEEPNTQDIAHGTGHGFAALEVRKYRETVSDTYGQAYITAVFRTYRIT